ncbi:helix-turn-helix domain-containing protein [Mucilaginibacter terrae]|uniref:AraC family transcriptional activator of pobA n=1 Tax=Mucilaginibacter terrae TaxID=1955052 RepID=A0ABU3H0C7_9SPHI|nr:helix-turn-helix domain-containing protein [Mucilaginibacter terrae]MDT3405473.1 AraC family transcriptional activator of pobA [Mucilaginibacter terrae]
MPSIRTFSIKQLLELFGLYHHHHGLHISSSEGNPDGGIISFPFRADHFSLALLKSGEAHFQVNLLKFTLKANHVLLMAPNVVRQLTYLSDDCEITWVAFTPEYLTSAGVHAKDIEVFEFLSAQLNPMINACEEDFNGLLGILNLLRFKLDTANTRVYQEDMMLHLFAALIYELSSLYKIHQSLTDIKRTRKEDLTYRFFKLLPQYIKEERSIQAYASLLNVSPKYLSQTIKEVTSIPAGNHIDEMVVLEAKLLLNSTELSIGQIAASLHFADQFMFSKYFKKHSGLTPSQYRQIA